MIIKKYNEDNYSSMLELDNNDSNDIVEYNGIEYHISRNIDEVTAWGIKKLYTYEIHADVSEEQVHNILKKIK